MIAEIISVGSEILLGDIVNTNAQYLAKQLSAIGIEVHFMTTVGDNRDRILSAVKTAYSRAEIAVFTGGLGPTKDDITKETLMRYFNREPVEDPRVLEMLKEILAKLGGTELSDSLRSQAIVPSDSTVLYNRNGTAPGIIMEDEGRICIMLPGVPKEMKPLFEEYCIPYLCAKSSQVLVSAVIKLASFDEAPAAIVGEAPVADKLSDLLDMENPTVAPYARDDGNIIRITARAKTKMDALAMIVPVAEKCCRIIGEQYVKSITEDMQ